MRLFPKVWPWMVAACLLLPTPKVLAQAWTPMKGHGVVTLGGQYTSVAKHLFSVDVTGVVDPATGYVGGPGNQFNYGDIASRSALLSADYSPLSRLALSAQAVAVTSRYRGLSPEAGIDDGKFHGDLQDLTVGARYRLPVNQLALTPFATFKTPLRHYSNIGHAALGLGLDETTLGLAAGRSLEPLLPQVAIQTSYSHAFVAGIHDFSLDRNVYSADVAYFLTRAVTLSAGFNYSEVVDGFDWWWMEVTMESFMDHDVASKTLVRHGGAGANIRLGSMYSVGLDYMWTISGSNTHSLQGATLSISRNLSMGAF